MLETGRMGRGDIQRHGREIRSRVCEHIGDFESAGLLKGGPSYVCYDAYDNGAKEEEKLGIQISFRYEEGTH